MANQVRNYTDLSGKVAVVVGGTSGLGRAIAAGFAQAGADVVASGRREQQVEEISSEIESYGRQTIRHTVNAADRASVDAFREAVVAKFGKVDILVNAAGKIKRTPTKDLSEAEWTDIL